MVRFVQIYDTFGVCVRAFVMFFHRAMNRISGKCAFMSPAYFLPLDAPYTFPSVTIGLLNISSMMKT